MREKDEMRVPIQLVNDFRERFQSTISQFAVDEKLLDSAELLSSDRFLARSIVPHVLKLSEMFNRLTSDSQSAGLDPYWKASSNPENLRLAYFLYFMPPNAFRMASVLTELSRLGFKWPFAERPFHAIEFGAGPASGASGLIAAAPLVGLPREGEVALIEQDRSVLQIGTRWAEKFAQSYSLDWSFRPFHRKIDLAQPMLPRAAPKFQLWISSFFLNEFSEDPELLLDRLIECWDRHVEDEGLIVLVEPALKLQSRKLLELRRMLIERIEGTAPARPAASESKESPAAMSSDPKMRDREGRRAEAGKKDKKQFLRDRAARDEKPTGKPRGPFQVLLPCLGAQACGALASEDDWCHEVVSWWRPAYFRKIDDMAQLDRKTLPFSYLVIAKSSRPLRELLPVLSEGTLHRLVSPSHFEGQDQEFFICGGEGKRRARLRTKEKLERGSILVNAEVRGDSKASRIDRVAKILPEPEASEADEKPVEDEESGELDE